MKKILNGIDFHTYITYGAREVITNKEELNRINVFPVADGDTGSNLAMTLQSMVDFAQVDESFSVTALSASEAGILGARGNSGVLFAQFLSGLAHALKGKDGVTVEDFVMAAEISEQKLHQVLFDPVEGTIITVIRAWVTSLASRGSHVEGFEELFTQTVPHAEKALEETTSQLEVLRVNQVVDSGAKGFVLFLRGILKYVQGKAEAMLPGGVVRGIPAIPTQRAERHGASEYRFCCECILKGPLDPEALSVSLSAMGDSLIVAGEGELRHIHLHTNDPYAVTTVMNRYGTVVRPKVEDMMLQSFQLARSADVNAASADGASNIALVTDSIADISPLLRDRYRIHVLPLGISVGDRQYLDRQTIDPKDFYALLDSSGPYPTSSLPTDPMIREKLEELLAHYDNVIVISVARQLSGTYDAFLRQVNALGADAGRVRLIDSRLNAGAQGLLVLKAARLAEQGLELEAIINELEETIKRSRIYVALASFRQAQRGGRIPKVVGQIGMLLNLKPIVSLDSQGKGTAFSISFSQRSLLERISGLIEKTVKANGIEAFAVVHGGNLEEAQRVAARLQKITGLKPEFIEEISSVTALHAGPGAVAVAFITRS